MNRGELLTVADRAIALVPPSKLRQLIGDMVALADFVDGPRAATPLLDEVRRFHDAAIRGEYYESFAVNSKNYMDKSRGTETFIAEFDRLMGKCIRAAAKKRRAPIRDAFEMLRQLRRRIDEASDSVIFFADEAGSWQVGVDWRLAAARVLSMPRRSRATRRVRPRSRASDLGLLGVRSAQAPRRGAKHRE